MRFVKSFVFVLIFSNRILAAAGDDCSTAIAVAVSPSYAACASTTVSTVGRPTSGNLPLPSCNGNFKDVWYTFTPSATQTIIEFTATSGTDQYVLQVLSGASCAALSELNCASNTAINYNIGANLSILVNTPAGPLYYIRIQRKNSNVDITGDLCIYNQNLSCAAPTNYTNKRDNNWYFGFNAGLDFSCAPPVPLSNSPMLTNEGSAAISDVNGNLLFYTDGMTIWDKNHNPMPNANGISYPADWNRMLSGDPSSTMSAIITPVINQPNKYYVFTTDGNSGTSTIGPKGLYDGLYYSVIDATLNSGLGDIDTAFIHSQLGVNDNKVPLADSTCEKIAAIKHTNGLDYWVISAKKPGDKLYAYLVCANGVSSIPQISTVSPIGEISWLAPSHDGKSLLGVSWSRVAYLMDFDASTGLASNSVQLANLPVSYRGSFYGGAFSPNDSIIYLTEGTRPDCAYPPKLFRYKRYAVALGLGSIMNTQTIDTFPGTPSCYIGALREGPDQKIYFSGLDTRSLNIINTPDNFNSPGIAISSLPIIGPGSYLGLPTHFLDHYNYVYPTVNAGLDTIICLGDSVQIGTPSVSGASYQWTPTTGLNNPNIATPKASPGGNITYTLKMTIACDFYDSVKVTLFTQPIAVGSSNSAVCEGNTLTLSAAGGNSYSWSGPNGFNSTQPNPAITPVTTAGNGVYTMTVTSADGCKDTAHVNVVVNPLPTILINGITALCSGNNTTLTVSGSSSYTWSPSTGISSTTGAIVTITSSNTYTITGTSSLGCTSNTTTTISVAATPTLSVSSNDSICSGQAANLSVGGANAYQWIPASGLNSSTGTSVISSATSSTTYTVVGSGTGGCADTSFITIYVDSIPIVNITGNNPICIGDIAFLTASGGSSYVWSSASGISSTTGTVISSNPISLSTYSVLATNSNGCTNIAVFSVSVTNVPLANAGNDSIICEGESLQLNASGGNNYNWYPAAGISNTGISNPVASPVLTSTYSVAVFNGACSDTDEVVITVFSMPLADAGNNTTIPSGTSTILSASGGGSYSWSPATGLSCITCQYPAATPQLATKYYVTVTDNNGCTSLDSVTITIDIQCGDIFVPNVFSPNEDEQNDILFVYSNCIKTILFKIYDRWGEKVFETNDITVGWNGKYKGKTMNTDVFIYFIEASLINGDEVSKKGNVSLVR